MIINYNGLKWLNGCLSSVAKTNYPNLDVYLIDNGSIDNSIEYVRKNFRFVKTIEYKNNLGFSEAYNNAIGSIDADHVVLLNNDTEILNPDWIKELVKKISEDPRIAAVACKMVSMRNTIYLDSVGGMGIPFWRGFVDIGKGERDYGQYDHKDFEPFAFCGGAVMIKKEIFEKIGGFDNKFFFYVEDSELSWRIRLNGYKISFAPKAKVAHFFSGSFNKKLLDEIKLFHSHKNLLRAYIKNCGPSLKWALTNYFLFSFLITMGFSFFEPKEALSVIRADPKKALSVLRAILWNFINLKDTLTWRAKIQSMRKENENNIFSKMYPIFPRYEPPDYPNLRRILNIIFEYSQLSRRPKL